MINIPHSSTVSKSKSRGFFWLCIGFSLAVSVVLMIFIVRGGGSANQALDPAISLPSASDENVLRDTSVSGVLNDMKTLTGVVDQVTTSGDGSILFFRVRSSLVDRDAVSLSASKNRESGELPMVERLFDVSPSDDVTVKSVDSLKSIVSGDVVRVVVKESVYDADRLTAESIEKIGSILIRETE